MRTEQSGPALTVVLDGTRPGNALTAEGVTDLHRVLDIAEADRGLRVLVVRAQGDAFCTGMDLVQAADDDEAEAARGVGSYFDLLERFASSDLLVVSVVDGRAVGGGVGLAAASDVVLATARANFSLPEVLWGLLPCAVLPFLVRRVGFQRAYSMTLGTLTVQAAKAADIGLVDELVDDPDRVLRRLLDRTSRVPVGLVAAAKQYCGTLAPSRVETRRTAVSTFAELSAGEAFRSAVTGYTHDGRYPWQKS
ncbi:enoyl-CoA hydratase-related protein [Micromonospora sp. ZYX-F-536]|uniref:enoyl-CoA hydratase-related protein n=1 Tax=Micromonospora sp. ZYX-F-536 TaxID=3457629 RepID=UPI004040C934